MQKFAEMSALEATKMFGEYLLKTGQADTQGEQQGMMEQMEREATSGALDDWKMQEMDPEALNNAMAQKGGFA